MTKLEKLKEIIKADNQQALMKWLEDFAYWFDSGGWFEEEYVIRYYLSTEYKS